MLLSHSTVKGHQYQVCPNGCRLYDDNSVDIVCEYCAVSRYKNSSVANEPAATMKILSIGDYLANMLSSPKNRELMRYRANRETTPGLFSDVFDGENYQRLLDNGHLTNPDDIVLGIFTDGFVNQQSKRSSLMIVHVVVFNLDPSIR